MYMYWDGTSELQTLHNELCLSQQRMATFAAAMSKNDKRSNSAYAEAAQAITMAQLYLVSADLEKIADPENPARNGTSPNSKTKLRPRRPHAQDLLYQMNFIA